MSKVEITSFDPDAIKASLIAFMQSKPEFADFNYEGAAINTLIDVLTRNSHYIAFMANMVGNESFLTSAQVRNNVVSHAQKLSYNPKSRTATTLVVGLTVTPATPSLKASITANKGSVFLSTSDNTTYTFISTSDVVLQRDITGVFKASNVTLKQGQLITSKYSYSTTTGYVELTNKNIDTSTIKVYVKDSATDLARREFSKVDNIIEVDLDSAVFHLSENTAGNPVIEFGKNRLGEEPLNGSIIEVEYIVVEAKHGNGVSKVIAATPIEGYSNITVTTEQAGYGGSERDTLDNIKFLAPRVFKAQNRTVIEEDYEGKVRELYPFIKSAKAWGGEKNIPAYYGRVFISVIPVEGYVVANSIKRVIENGLGKYSVGSITPVLVDPEYVFMDLSVDIIYDSTGTSETFNQTSARVASRIKTYNEEELNNFSFWYDNSQLEGYIKKIAGVKSVEIEKRCYYQFDVARSTLRKYEISFYNEIVPGTARLDGFVVDVTASSQYISDDAKGSVYLTMTREGITTKSLVGSIDYTTGAISFSTTFLATTPEQLKFYVTPANKNFYTERNYVATINSSNINQIFPVSSV